MSDEPNLEELLALIQRQTLVLQKQTALLRRIFADPCIRQGLREAFEQNPQVKMVLTNMHAALLEAAHTLTWVAPS
jgi:hypothetical protein